MIARGRRQPRGFQFGSPGRERLNKAFRVVRDDTPRRIITRV
jgi:hypothetical protein